MWYENAKFGIFIHWGLYSIPAFANEWYPRNMYIQGSREYEHHLATYGVHKTFGYKDFIPLFKAEHFNAEEWANLFKLSGAKYVMPVAEHHDGFQMYKSAYSHYNTYEMGPKRDLVGEMKDAFEQQGLEFCVSIELSTGSSCLMARNLIPISMNRLYVEISIGHLCPNPIITIYSAPHLIKNFWRIG